MNYRLTASQNWWGTDHVKNFDYIKKYFLNKTKLSFLEIGTWEARTSTWLLDNILLDSESKIWCVDQEFRENGKYNLSLHGKKACLIEDSSLNVLPELLRTYKDFFDFIYVDGFHYACYTLFDMVLSWQLLKKGGLMLVDDYGFRSDNWSFKNSTVKVVPPKPAVDSFITCYEPYLSIIFSNYQVCLKKDRDTNIE